MLLAIVFSRANLGMQSPLVTVEAHLSPGLPRFSIVGLPETAVKESKDRVRSALINSYFKFPKGRITINLAPADLPKEGGRFDLPIALGILAASQQIPTTLFNHHEFVGELALSGELREIKGVLASALASQKAQRCLIIPSQNAEQAALVQDAKILSATHLLEVCAYLKAEKALANLPPPATFIPQNSLDLADIKGQFQAKRALEIAAAGRHNLLFIGPPGTGKTMLANRVLSLLPRLSQQEALEVATIASLSTQHFDYRRWQAVPFRNPHHTASNIALVGGGQPPRPGEISLAHQGILFLDELAEFNRHALEALREPLEAGQITISRAALQTQFPAQFQLIAAMNPCPCGYFNCQTNPCRCTPNQIQRYLNKLSGPLLDRIDMHVEISQVNYQSMSHTENSASVAKRVLSARTIQLSRQGKLNTHLDLNETKLHCALDSATEQWLLSAIDKLHYSLRVYHRILRLARTIVDLEGGGKILISHLSEALSYRCLDKIINNFQGPI